MTAPKIAVLDIETAPIKGNVWSLWQQTLGLNQVDEDWHLLSFAAKWLGQKDVEYQDQQGVTPITNDRHLLDRLWHWINEADIIIAHNGQKFDLRKINARFITLGYKPPSPVVVIDTLLKVRQVAAFTSNKLEFLTNLLCTKTKKRAHGKFPGFSLWVECMAGNPAAWKEMRLYNIDDIKSLEELYLIIRPWIIGHPNVAAYEEQDKPACPKCASHNVTKRGFYFTTAGKYQRFQCSDCGGWSRGRYTKNTMDTRRNLLSN